MRIRKPGGVNSQKFYHWIDST